MMKLSADRFTTLVKQRYLPYNSYITTCGDKIYQTNYNTGTVTCYTIKGEMLWEYKDPSVLKDPWGITMDDKCIVYVTSYSYNSVVVI